MLNVRVAVVVPIADAPKVKSKELQPSDASKYTESKIILLINIHN